MLCRPLYYKFTCLAILEIWTSVYSKLVCTPLPEYFQALFICVFFALFLPRIKLNSNLFRKYKTLPRETERLNQTHGILFPRYENISC